MDTYLKQGYIVFKTLSPVFIGSGKELGKKEYIHQYNKGTIMLMNLRKMYAGLAEKDLLQPFEKYMLGNDPSAKDLLGFMKSRGINERIYSKWSDGTVEAADKEISLHSNKNIQLFMRGAAGKPYIPGSSFKGMLRTILETAYMLDNPEDAVELAQEVQRELNKVGPYNKVSRNSFLAKPDAEADIRSMHREIYPVNKDNREASLRDQNNDVLKGLMIGDSEPLELSDMCICQKIDMTTGGIERPLNMLRECIKPGVQIKIPVTIDTVICPYTVKDILAAMKKFYGNYQNEFGSRFKKAPQTRNSTTFYLGGGAGYVSKTITYSLAHRADGVGMTSEIINATLSKSVQLKHKHEQDIRKGASPHLIKCTRYKGKLYQMGACCVVKYHG